MAYRHGDFTLIQLEGIRKKYSGESFLLDNVGIETAFAASRKDQIDRAITQQQKKAEKSLIYNAALGDAIGGTAGAIIGAASSAQKSAQESAALEVEKAAADKAFRNAVTNDLKK